MASAVKYSHTSESDHILPVARIAEMAKENEKRKAEIVATRLDPPSPRPTLALTLENVFTEEECNELIAATEALGYGVALVNTGMARQEHIPGYRDSARVMTDDFDFAKLLFDRIKDYLPPLMHGGYPIKSLNERMRFLRYYPGEQFQPHYDGSFSRKGECSMVTVQLYLNGGFGGGATTFLSQVDGKPDVPVVPKAGKVLIFEHRILHEGSEVTSGQKYCLRTDVMYGDKKR